MPFLAREVQKIRYKVGFIVICESSENNFDRPKKKGRQNFQHVLKIRPSPQENPRSGPPCSEGVLQAGDEV